MAYGQRPITWQSLQQPDFRGAADMMRGAGQGLNQGFDIFSKLIGRQETSDAANWQQQKVNNTQEFMNALQSAQNPEELKAKQEVLTQMRQQFGAQVDDSAARAAQDGRMQILQNRVTADRNFANSELDARLAPLVQQHDAMLAQGDTLGALALRESNPELKSRMGGTLALKARDTERGDVRFNQETKQWEHINTMAPLQEQQARESILSAQQGRAISQQQADAATARLDQAGRTAATEAATKRDTDFTKRLTDGAETTLKTGIYAGGTVNDPTGETYVRKYLKDAGVEGKAADNALMGIRQLASVNGRDTPAIALVQALQENLGEVRGKEGWISMFNTPGSMNGVKASLEKRWNTDKAFVAEVEKAMMAREFLQDPIGKRSAYAQSLGLEVPTMPAPAGQSGGARGDIPSADRGNLPKTNAYDVVLGNGKYGTPDKPLTSMTIGEAQDFGRSVLQKNSAADGVGKINGKVVGSSAMGAFQFVASTLEKVAPKVLGADWKNVKFTPEVQDRLAEYLFNQTKDGNLKAQWESLPDSRPGAYANVPWSEMRHIIAKGESGPLGDTSAITAQQADPVIPMRPVPQQAAETPAPTPSEQVKAELAKPSNPGGLMGLLRPEVRDFFGNGGSQRGNAALTQKALDRLEAEKKSPPVTAVDVSGKAVGAVAPPPASPLLPDPKKVSTSASFSLNPAGSADTHKDAAPVSIPADVKLGKPQTVVEAKPSAAIRGTGEKAVVTFVQDGDTAQLKRDDGSSLNCRIDKIDAPETAKTKVGKPGQPFGEESKRKLEDLIDKKEVTVRVVRPDKESYGRQFCQIEISGSDVGLEMVRAGAAWLYRKYSQDPTYDQAEKAAKSEKSGIWSKLLPESPENFRRRTDQ